MRPFRKKRDALFDLMDKNWLHEQMLDLTFSLDGAGRRALATLATGRDLPSDFFLKNYKSYVKECRALGVNPTKILTPESYHRRFFEGLGLSKGRLRDERRP